MENVSTLMEKFQFDEEQWISLAVFQEATYSRILLHTNNDFSVFLLCWKPQQKTPIHGHAADNHAWIRVMAGRCVASARPSLKLRATDCRKRCTLPARN